MTDPWMNDPDRTTRRETPERFPGLPTQYAELSTDVLATIVRLQLPADHAAHVALRELQLRALEI